MMVLAPSIAVCTANRAGPHINRGTPLSRVRDKAATQRRSPQQVQQFPAASWLDPPPRDRSGINKNITFLDRELRCSPYPKAPLSCPLWVTCGRRLGKNFLTLLQHWSGAVT